jgi:hypothetical protein
MHLSFQLTEETISFFEDDDTHRESNVTFRERYGARAVAAPGGESAKLVNGG